MYWCNSLFIRFNLADPSRKIIVDHTGLLLSSEFQSFLIQKNIISKHAENLQEVIRQLNDDSVKLLICTCTDIPLYLHDRADIYYFAYNDLPFHIAPNLFSQLHREEIIGLCNYLSSHNIHHVITNHNIKELLQESEKHRQQLEIQSLLQQTDEILSAPPDYQKIIDMGVLWGKLVYTSYCLKQELPRDRENRTDQYVLDYILSGKLKNIWFTGPGDVKSVDRIVSYLKNGHPEKFALICFDGMGIAEWELLKDYFNSCSLTYDERFVYALIPTTTSVSRTAIFSGSHEIMYENKSVNELREFKMNFPNHDHKHFREKDPVSSDELLGITAVTMLFNFFDEVGHSTQFPPDTESKSLYFDSVKNYLNRMKLMDTFHLLLHENYRIFICSDHGCTVATGNGKNIDKWLQDKFARRACIVDNTSLLESYRDCPQYKVPFIENKTVLLAKNRTMFDSAGKTAITHGGVTVEELIVPFAEITAL